MGARCTKLVTQESVEFLCPSCRGTLRPLTKPEWKCEFVEICNGSAKSGLGNVNWCWQCEQCARQFCNQCYEKFGGFEFKYSWEDCQEVRLDRRLEKMFGIEKQLAWQAGLYIANAQGRKLELSDFQKDELLQPSKEQFPLQVKFSLHNLPSTTSTALPLGLSIGDEVISLVNHENPNTGQNIRKGDRGTVKGACVWRCADQTDRVNLEFLNMKSVDLLPEIEFRKLPGIGRKRAAPLVLNSLPFEVTPVQIRVEEERVRASRNVDSDVSSIVYQGEELPSQPAVSIGNIRADLQQQCATLEGAVRKIWERVVDDEEYNTDDSWNKKHRKYVELKYDQPSLCDLDQRSVILMQEECAPPLKAGIMRRHLFSLAEQFHTRIQGRFRQYYLRAVFLALKDHWRSDANKSHCVDTQAQADAENDRSIIDDFLWRSELDSQLKASTASSELLRQARSNEVHLQVEVTRLRSELNGASARIQKARGEENILRVALEGLQLQESTVAGKAKDNETRLQAELLEAAAKLQKVRFDVEIDLRSELEKRHKSEIEDMVQKACSEEKNLAEKAQLSESLWRLELESQLKAESACSELLQKTRSNEVHLQFEETRLRSELDAANVRLQMVQLQESTVAGKAKDNETRLQAELLEANAKLQKVRIDVEIDLRSELEKRHKSEIEDLVQKGRSEESILAEKARLAESLWQAESEINANLRKARVGGEYPWVLVQEANRDKDARTNERLLLRSRTVEELKTLVEKARLSESLWRSELDSQLTAGSMSSELLQKARSNEVRMQFEETRLRSELDDARASLQLAQGHEIRLQSEIDAEQKRALKSATELQRLRFDLDMECKKNSSREDFRSQQSKKNEQLQFENDNLRAELAKYRTELNEAHLQSLRSLQLQDSLTSQTTRNEVTITSLKVELERAKAKIGYREQVEMSPKKVLGKKEVAVIASLRDDMSLRELIREEPYNSRQVEIYVDSSVRVPPTCWISARTSGSRERKVQSLTRLASHPVRFPCPIGGGELKLYLRLSEVRAETNLVIHPHRQIYNVQLEGQNGKTCQMCIHVSAAAKPHEEDMLTGHYLRRHGIEDYFRALMKVMVENREPEPLSFMHKQIRSLMKSEYQELQHSIPITKVPTGSCEILLFSTEDISDDCEIDFGGLVRGQSSVHKLRATPLRLPLRSDMRLPLEIRIMKKFDSDKDIAVNSGQSMYEVAFGSAAIRLRTVYGSTSRANSDAGDVHSNSEAQKYLDDHNIIALVQELMQTLHSTQPLDPFSFLLQDLKHKIEAVKRIAVPVTEVRHIQRGRSSPSPLAPAQIQAAFVIGTGIPAQPLAPTRSMSPSPLVLAPTPAAFGSSLFSAATPQPRAPRPSSPVGGTISPSPPVLAPSPAFGSFPLSSATPQPLALTPPALSGGTVSPSPHVLEPTPSAFGSSLLSAATPQPRAPRPLSPRPLSPLGGTISPTLLAPLGGSQPLAISSAPTPSAPSGGSMSPSQLVLAPTRPALGSSSLLAAEVRQTVQISIAGAEEVTQKIKERDKLASEAAMREAARLEAEASIEKANKERLAAEAAAKAEAERLETEAKEKAEQEKLAKVEVDKLAREAETKAEQERAARAEKERLAIEVAAKAEAKRAEAEAKAKEEADRLEVESLKADRESLAREEEDRLATEVAAKANAKRLETEAKEKAKHEILAKVEADKLAREAETKAEQERAARAEKEERLAIAPPQPPAPTPPAPLSAVQLQPLAPTPPVPSSAAPPQPPAPTPPATLSAPPQPLAPTPPPSFGSTPLSVAPPTSAPTPQPSVPPATLSAPPQPLAPTPTPPLSTAPPQPPAPTPPATSSAAPPQPPTPTPPATLSAPPQPLAPTPTPLLSTAPPQPPAPTPPATLSTAPPQPLAPTPPATLSAAPPQPPAPTPPPSFGSTPLSVAPPTSAPTPQPPVPPAP